jgi:hypothetical protein
MQYPKILFGKFCTMIRHEQSVWTLIPSFLTPDQNLSGKKFPMKIEKALQAPIIFFSANWYRGVSLELSYQTRINAVGSQSSLPPKKAKTQSSGGKRMTTIFWAEEGILLIERW